MVLINRRILITFVCLCLFTALEFWVVNNAFATNQATYAADSHAGAVIVQIVDGDSAMKTYANRLLGAGLVRLAAMVGRVDYDEAYAWVTFGALLIANFVWYAAGQRLFAGAGWLLVLANAMAVFALQDRNQCIWDWITYATAPVFAILVLTGARPYYFVLLFLVEITNREAGLFIPLWLLLTAFDSPPVKERARRAAGAAALLVAGGWYVQYLRSFYTPKPGDAIFHMVMGQTNELALNIERMQNDTLPERLVAAGLVIGLFAALYAQRERTHWAVAVLIFAMAAANFLVGTVTELRIWLDLAPFFILLCARACLPQRREAAPAAVNG